MPNLLFLSSNPDFAADLKDQLRLYASEFNVFEADDPETFFDMVLLDERPEKVKDYLGRSVPLFLLLKSGADDNFPGAEIIFKPFSLSTFLDQIRSAIHLYDNSQEGYLQFNRYELRPFLKEIYNLRNSDTVKLTEKEVAILKYLYKAGDKIVTKNELLQEVWGYNPAITTHTIETHIYRLRQKVEQDAADAQLILTSEGGYQLQF